MLFLPNQAGYDIFTSYIHQNKFTGIIHGIGLPISAVGLFVVIYSVIYMFTNFKKSSRWTSYIGWFILGGYTSGYITYAPVTGTITIYVYSCIIFTTIQLMNKHCYSQNVQTLLVLGIVLLVLPVIMMEFVGHWYLEGSGSDISQLFNSIYHTPLYGIRALIGY